MHLILHGFTLSARAPIETQLLNFLTQCQADFQTKVIGDLSYLHADAVRQHGIRLLHVESLGYSQFKLHFEYDWQLFNGCRGMDESGTIQSAVRFKKASMDTLELDLSAFGNDTDGNGF
ncbi:hypothetical protein [Echinimonas agarilytica]|uniref:Uncharacterized protein n=1 Tax=Echinimonas agarilytica TaxID=1215918 RepID=A0AA42B607_9GAMM|nr:hypothetical protein [Echinimonas agarilytica]MCM2678262.1 hypothetical protein [Echinimonas agarilytica]